VYSQFQQSELFLFINRSSISLIFKFTTKSTSKLIYTFAYFNNISLDNKSITCELNFFLILFYYLSFYFKPTVSYLTSLDRYAILCIFAIVGQCIWHAIIGAVIFLSTPQDQLTPSMWYTFFDRYVFITMITVFIIMHIVLIIWLYLVPFGHRKNMSKKDLQYQFLISNMIIEKNSKDIGKNTERSSLFMRIPMWTKT